MSTSTVEIVSENVPTLRPDPMAELTPAQREAVDQLCQGHSIVDAAKAAHVHRRTVHRWLTADPTFRAAYNTWQKDALELARARLLGLADDAVTAVAESIHNGNAATALVVLKGLKALTPPTPGPTDPAQLQQQAQNETRAAAARAIADEDRAIIGMALTGEL